MVVEEIYVLRKEFDEVCEKCDKLEAEGLWPLADQISMKECLRLELANYCIYLTAADDTVRSAEALFFKVALGFEMSADEISAEIRENNLYSDDFETRVPVVISEIKGVKDAGDAHQVGCLIGGLFYKMGRCIISCDGEIMDSEKKNLDAYMDTINGFLGEEEV